MGAERGDLGCIRPRHHAPVRPRVARPGGDVIGVEQKGELLVEAAITGQMRGEQESFEKPSRMRAVPFGWARVRHGLDDLVFRTERRGAAFGFRSYGTECGQPSRPQIGRMGRELSDGWDSALVVKANGG